MSKDENEREKKAYNSGTKREMKRITAQYCQRKGSDVLLWSKKARPFINFLVRHFPRLPRAVDGTSKKYLSMGGAALRDLS